MGRFVSVPDFFSHVYLVDFSPSLCGVAQKRFERLGWKNVTVVCEDARKFRLEDYESGMSPAQNLLRSPLLSYFKQQNPRQGGADLVTMSYSLSMIVSGKDQVSGSSSNMVMTCAYIEHFIARLLLSR